MIFQWHLFCFDTLFINYIPIRYSQVLKIIQTNRHKYSSIFLFLFQFDNDIAMGTSQSSLSSNSLKLLHRNFSYDSSAPTTPSTPSSLCPKTFRGSPQFSDSSNNDTNTTLFGSATSRSNSPPDPSNDLNLFENNNLLDMLNYLTINQQPGNQSYQVISSKW